MKRLKFLAVCLSLFAAGCSEAPGIYATFAQAVSSACGGKYPCTFGFDRLPADWQTLVVFNYTAPAELIERVTGKAPDLLAEFSDKYAVIKRSGEVQLEVRFIDVEGTRDGDVVFDLGAEENHRSIQRAGTSFLVNKVNAGARGDYLLVKVVSTAD